MARGSSSIFWGVVFLLFGVLFLLNNLGLIYFNLWDFIADWWPLVLVILGLSIILKRRSRQVVE